MTRLAHPRIFKGDAVIALLQLYEEDPDFAAQRNSIRHPYEKLIMRFTRDVASYWLSTERNLENDFRHFSFITPAKARIPCRNK